MRRLLLLGVYLSLLPIVTITLIGYMVLVLHASSTTQTTASLPQPEQFQVNPDKSAIASYVPKEGEARVEALTEFFKRYNSPLLPHAQAIVAAADKYSLDWKLVPAIAMQESTLCKRIPKDSHNCWGFGIYGGKVTKFANYDEAIETITKTLAREYKEKRGLEHPAEIGTRYTPGNTNNWASNVALVMTRIQENL